MPPTGQIIALPKPPAPESPPVERCTCDAYVTGTRGSTATYFYCGRCGKDWSVPAPPVIRKRAADLDEKRCRCARTCRWCRLPRGRA